MIRFFVVAVVLGAVWLHWRAAYTAEVRAALDDLAANQDRLDDLVEDLRDRRLVHRCKAALTDHRAGDADLCREHVADALASARVAAISPVVSGQAPATPPEQSRARVRAAFMSAAGLPHTATAVAGLYADILDGFVLDERDAPEADAIGASGLEVLLADTLATGAGRVALAEAVLDTFSGRSRSPSTTG